jgi:two-component system cell cycle response regulator
VRAKTFKTTLCLMMLDIDHFKRLNDRYGHPFGDQVLRRVGELLNASVYDTDFVARYGGEEFVVVLPRAEPAGALRKAEAIRRTLENERFALALETIRVTASFGIAHFPRDAATPEELIGQADAALYQAKSQGRNRVIDCEALRRS